MDNANLLSDLVVWAIGAIALVGGVLTVLAIWSMGRAGYRKD